MAVVSPSESEMSAFLTVHVSPAIGATLIASELEAFGDLERLFPVRRTCFCVLSVRFDLLKCGQRRQRCQVLDRVAAQVDGS